MYSEILNLLKEILEEQKEQTKILQCIDTRLEVGVPTRNKEKNYTFEELKGGGMPINILKNRKYSYDGILSHDQSDCFSDEVNKN